MKTDTQACGAVTTEIRSTLYYATFTPTHPRSLYVPRRAVSAIITWSPHTTTERLRQHVLCFHRSVAARRRHLPRTRIDFASSPNRVIFRRPRQVKLASKRFLAGSLGLSGGVMLYLSLVEILGKSQGAFVAHGHSEVSGPSRPNEHIYTFMILPRRDQTSDRGGHMSAGVSGTARGVGCALLSRWTKRGGAPYILIVGACSGDAHTAF